MYMQSIFAFDLGHAIVLYKLLVLLSSNWSDIDEFIHYIWAFCSPS